VSQPEATPAAPAGWRVRAVRALNRLPAPARRSLWRARRAAARAQRRRLERRGDFSRSRPALYEMDRKLEELFAGHTGFFVEAGANDGYAQSNTYALERIHGWKGLLVEPTPELHREATRERPGSTVVRAALVPEGHPEPEVTLHYGGLMTIVRGVHDDASQDRAWVAAAHAVAQEEPEHEFTAPARTLSSLLDEIGAPPVDLLSLDVEGFEGPVLRGLDLDRHGPRYILAEVGDDPARRTAIEDVLGDRYVAERELSPFDVLYRLR
jgi:FkbM family methyltransferase